MKLHSMGVYKKKVEYIDELKSQSDIKQKRKALILQLMNVMSQDRNVIYIDETSLNLLMPIRYSYCWKGQIFV